MSLRRFTSSGDSFELGLEATISSPEDEPFSESTVMEIPEIPDTKTSSEEVGHTHLTKKKKKKLNTNNFHEGIGASWLL